MIVEISKYDPTNIDKKQFTSMLNSLEAAVKSDDKSEPEAAQYYLYTREAVNAKKSREMRSAYLSGLIHKCAVL